jgi:NAD+ synthase (glutamine-hydrolysing)
MINIACISPDGAPCSVGKNADEIMRLIHINSKADIVLFPRLALSTAGCGDLFLQDALISACESALKNIAAGVKDRIAVIGTPVKDGAGNLFDMAAVLHGGKVQRFVPLNSPKKPFSQDFPSVLYDIPVSREPFILNGQNICIDSIKQYSICLMPSCRPYLAGDEALICDWLKASSKNCIAALAQAGQAESSTDYCHAGVCGIAINQKIEAYRGAFAKQEYCFYSGAAKSNKECILKSEPFLDKKTPYLKGDKALVLCDFIRIPAQALSLRLKRINAENIILGLSGGLDSAMALLIADRARRILNLNLSSLNIYTLPAQGTGKATLSNAEMLCNALNIPLNSIDISQAVFDHLKAINHKGQEDAAFENAQARERTQILMDIANMLGGIMIGTGDMSELALGFTTYGGDHMSMYGVNSGLLKTMIRFAMHNEAQKNEHLKPALSAILDTPISPELKSGAQHTEKILGPYILNDFFLYYALKGFAPEKIIKKALSAFENEYSKEFLAARLKAFYRRFFANQFKRSCLPDGPKVTDISLSPRGEFNMPSDASPEVFLDLL